MRGWFTSQRTTSPTHATDQVKEAMSEAVANMRWLIAAGIRDLQAMLVELGKVRQACPATH